ncbi:MAG TPA: Crp/Fnr family transcriptional regulator [Sorangium sp.]|nr:Crp/Fnr family transcriptional regulator [Sorangium sp.]
MLRRMGPEQRTFEAGHVLFREGDGGAAMYVIRDGSISLTRLVDGQPAEVARLVKGDFVGEVALICGRPHATTATVQRTARCLRLEAAHLEALITHSDEAAVRLVRALTERLADSYEALSRLGHRDPFVRVLQAIVRHAERGEPNDDGVWIRKRLGDIGKEVALTPAELGEVSKSIIRQQLLKVRRDGILVPDVARLYAAMSQPENADGP